MDSGEALGRIRAAFAAPDPPRPGGLPGLSAVLLPLRPRPGGLGVVFTRRADHLQAHAGQVSFPGGRVEKGETPLQAALRETEEEIGVAPGLVDVVGHVTDFLTFRNNHVCAYAGVLAEAAVPRVASVEVAAVFEAPLARLLAGDAYEGRALPPGVRGGRGAVVHYWHLPEATVWGITGELLARFLRQAFGWTPPRPARQVTEPGEFVPLRDNS